MSEEPNKRNKTYRRSATRERLRPVVVLVFLVLIFGMGFSSCWESEEDPSANSNEVVNTNGEEALPANLSNALEAVEEDDEGAYASFSHSMDYHSRLPCLSCHTRETNASKVSFPGKVDHSPCAGCHTIQFRNKQSSICTICHVDPEAGSMKAFPPMRSFGAKFDHSKHRRANCSTCHKPRGKTLSIPRRLAGHTTCFACHTSNSNNAMASCATCHEQGRRRFRAPGGRAFRANFSHASHGRKQDLNCADCHTVVARGSGRRQVSSPATAMHVDSKARVSCKSCHNDQRAFGGENFANCKQCHTGDSFKF